MNRHNRRWSWLLALGLLLALFMVKSPVEGDNNPQTFNIVYVTSPTPQDAAGYIEGTAVYNGAPPTFTVELIDVNYNKNIYSAPVVDTTWLDSSNWEVKLNLTNVPNGEYWVRVRAQFSNGLVIVKTHLGNGEPECGVTLCKG
jgi:hypothetical protein